jgi:hypothetical protein
LNPGLPIAAVAGDGSILEVLGRFHRGDRERLPTTGTPIRIGFGMAHRSVI